MFESSQLPVDASATAAALEANERAAIEIEARRLVLAAHWADLHPGDAVDPAALPGRERAIRPGGTGTPEVAEFALADLAVALRGTVGSAARLVGDALDLRHRLPISWAAVRAGQAPVYQARRIAVATRRLSLEQAAEVDARVAPRLGRVSFGRLLTLLEAFVYEADPEGADEAAEAAARERFVRLGRTSEHGLRFIMARVSAGDAVWIDAMLTRLAEILRLEGDGDPLDVRRAKALGLFAQPAEMLRLLCRHQHDPSSAADPEGEEPDSLFDEPTPAPTPAPAPASEPAPAPRTSRRLEIVPPPIDPARVRPRAIVYVHLSEQALSAGRGIARVEDVGPVLLNRLAQLLGDRSQIVLKPVIDLNDVPAPVDSYEIPDRIREHLRLRQPVDVFPYAASGARSMDLDHTIAYVPMKHGGPPGQTSVGGLGPNARFHHRLNTHGGWRIRQPEPGVWLWRSRRGRVFLVNSTGTHEFGHSEFARRMWRAAKAPPAASRGAPASIGSAEQIARGLLNVYALAT